ncbi:MAG: amylo-alpha-1,6-glucosidase [Candidatus Onthomonas sp.]
MKFVYGKQDMLNQDRGEETCWLLTNGLGGYASATAAFSVNRCDQGLLMAADPAPNHRFTLVHRLSEQLRLGDRTEFLSTQSFADGRAPEQGYRHLSSFVWDCGPKWIYHVGGVQIRRRCAMEHGTNTAAILYDMENRSDTACTLKVTPSLLFSPKGEPLWEKRPFRWDGGTVRANGHTLYVDTDGTLTQVPLTYERLSYPRDGQDGRAASGLAAACFQVEQTVLPGETVRLELVFSDRPIRKFGAAISQEMEQRYRVLEQQSGFSDPVARQLALSADAFLARRDSTGGDTIVAGYPFFGDWGRDTMIALPGCALATGRYDTAKSILNTFLACERDGLVPNLFPEGTSAPQYNTVDAALLLINCIWLYYQRTGDAAFVRAAWPVLVRIVEAYQRGTHYGIAMEEDGLIRAGEGLDQVTWMDVCVDGILPTPRHGKPVEVNAYWYNALCVLRELAPISGADGRPYAAFAERVKASFVEQFWMEDRGWLKDVLSGTKADTQLRCNQIWAVTMPFTMLSPEQERRVVDAVWRQLYTPCGLRTLSPEDGEFHPTYGGPQRERDMAYHQGTVWVFPLGAYYLAYLKTRGNTPEAARQVRELLEPLESMLREGCVGQLPEIYNGGCPGSSQGCYAQAWSVGELLRVYEVLESIEKGADHNAG